MSNLSIYQTSWINLVFEGRNKEYGAYQLRKDSSKTTIFALFCGFLLVVLITCIPLLLNFFDGTKSEILIAKETPKMGTFIQLQPKKPFIPKKAFVPPVKTQSNKSSNNATLSKPIIVEKTQETAKTLVNSEQPISSISPGSASGANTNEVPASSDEKNFAPTDTNSSRILNTNELDKNPVFPGGIKVFLNYVGSNFRTPEVEMEQTVKVYVSFVVEIDGSMSSIQVENDPGFGLGKEAIRVLKSLKTKWEPGQKDGQKVRTFYKLPISVMMN